MRIGIVGLGLIGGSLALDWRRAGHQVIGVSRQDETVALALERGRLTKELRIYPWCGDVR